MVFYFSVNDNVWLPFEPPRKKMFLGYGASLNSELTPATKRRVERWQMTE